MDPGLKNKVALINGGSMGIGKASAITGQTIEVDGGAGRGVYY